ncbi:MAG: hypothetical protein C0402_02290 [Thermodesulfovibrio sp.]|nr:hypothetical protein [Thermodesulfovibrio sp.]
MPSIRHLFRALMLDIICLTPLSVNRERYHARLHAGVTQAELARKIGTKSTAISRLESPNYGKALLSMLRKIAGALDCELQVRLVPKH